MLSFIYNVTVFRHKTDYSPAELALPLWEFTFFSQIEKWFLGNFLAA